MEPARKEKHWQHVLFRDLRIVYESFGVALAAALSVMANIFIIGPFAIRKNVNVYFPSSRAIPDAVYYPVVAVVGAFVGLFMAFLVISIGNFSVRIIRDLKEEIPPYPLKGYWETYIPIALLSLPVYVLLWCLVESMLSRFDFIEILSHALWWSRIYGIAIIVMGFLLWKDKTLSIRPYDGKDSFLIRLDKMLTEKLDFHLISDEGITLVYEPTYKPERGQIPGKITVRFEKDVAKIVGTATYIVRLKKFKRYLKYGA